MKLSADSNYNEIHIEDMSKEQFDKVLIMATKLLSEEHYAEESEDDF